MKWKGIRGLRFISVFLFLVILAPTVNNWKYLIHKIKYEEKKLDSRITQEIKFRTREIPMRKSFEPVQYTQEKNLDSWNTDEKKSRSHEIPKRKSIGPTKYQREKILDPRRHDGTMVRWHYSYKRTRGQKVMNTRCFESFTIGK